MGWSIKLGRIFGIEIKVHLTFALILIWGAFNYGGSAGPWYGVLVTLALFALVFLHELGHSVAALGLGIPVKDITLLPIGGLARLERMPEKPVHELMVALAGPLVNVLLVFLLIPVVIALGLGDSTPFSMRLIREPGIIGLLTFLVGANISLAVFNMIPAFPLDGGRVFRAILGFFTTYHQATRIAVNVGRMFAFVLGIFAIFSGQFWLALIAFFIFIAGGQEGQAVAARNLLRGVRVGQVLTPSPITFYPQDTVGQVAATVMHSPQSNFPVVDPISGQFLGVTSGSNVAQAMAEGYWQRGISEIMHHAPHIPVVALNSSLDEVQEKISQTSNRVAAVYDGLDFRGLISLEEIYRIFQMLSRNRRGVPGLAW